MKRRFGFCFTALVCFSTLLLASACTSFFGPNHPTTYVEPITGIEFVLIPGGCFQMGDIWNNGDANESPVHKVCLDDFYLAKTEVTQEQWLKIMEENPSYFKDKVAHPVESVSWNDAQSFLKNLSLSNDRSFRLPTEAEWEYACRSGGKEEQYCGGDDLKNLAWFDRTGGGSTQAVATRQPNGLGLFDMSGNVWEYCSDLYAKDSYANSPEKNPKGAVESQHVIKRGGSWSINPRYLRSTVRGRSAKEDRHYSTGFRVAFSVQP